jgi:hypothetical protein
MIAHPNRIPEYNAVQSNWIVISAIFNEEYRIFSPASSLILPQERKVKARWASCLSNDWMTCGNQGRECLETLSRGVGEWKEANEIAFLGAMGNSSGEGDARVGSNGAIGSARSSDSREREPQHLARRMSAALRWPLPLAVISSQR